MDTRFLTPKFFLAAFLILAAPIVRAQDGFQGALGEFTRTNSLGQIARLSSPTLTIADFDGDNKPDGAILLRSNADLGKGNFAIELHLTGHHNSEIWFHSPESSLMIEALDIDHDGAIDLIIEESISHKRLQVWINDGHGNFEKGRLEDFPSVTDSIRDRISCSERLDSPVLSLPTQRGFETMLIACQIAGRPPSQKQFTAHPTNLPPGDQAFSLTPSRAPPFS